LLVNQQADEPLANRVTGTWKNRVGAVFAVVNALSDLPSVTIAATYEKTILTQS